MEFDEIFKTLLLENKQNPDTNVLKLETPIPANYEASMDNFLENFFAIIAYLRSNKLNIVHTTLGFLNINRQN